MTSELQATHKIIEELNKEIDKRNANKWKTGPQTDKKKFKLDDLERDANQEREVVLDKKIQLL
jgi:hypothetical protein